MIKRLRVWRSLRALDRGFRSPSSIFDSSIEAVFASGAFETPSLPRPRSADPGPRPFLATFFRPKSQNRAQAAFSTRRFEKTKPTVAFLTSFEKVSKFHVQKAGFAIHDEKEKKPLPHGEEEASFQSSVDGIVPNGYQAKLLITHWPHASVSITVIGSADRDTTILWHMRKRVDMK